MQAVSEDYLDVEMSWQVADGCTKLLAAVSKFVDAGNWVIYRPESHGGTYIDNKALAKNTYLRRENGVWVFDMWVKKPPGAGREEINTIAGTAGFSSAGERPVDSSEPELQDMSGSSSIRPAYGGNFGTTSPELVEEATTAITKSVPGCPSPADRAAHELIHLPFQEQVYTLRPGQGS